MESRKGGEASGVGRAKEKRRDLETAPGVELEFNLCTNECLVILGDRGCQP